MEQGGRIFMIDNGKGVKSSFQSLLETQGYEVFATDNAYKLIKYAGELKPKMYIMDSLLEGINAWQVLDFLVHNHYLENAPAVMLNVESGRPMVLGASHYISSVQSEKDLVDIVNAYCKGGGGYQVLFLESKGLSTAEDFSKIDDLNISYFKVHDIQGAKIFLQRNSPQVMLVHSTKEDYDKIRNEVGFENTFYVENSNNLKKIFSFIK